MTNYEKIIKVMCWDVYDGETPEQTYQRKIGNAIPPPNEIINIVEAGGLQKWAEGLAVGSQEELYNKILNAIRLTISDPIFNDRKLVNTFPPFANFFYFCQKLDRNGKTSAEAEAISDVAWNGVICKRNNQNNIQQMFSVEPDPDKYKAISEKIRQIWGFSEKEIDAFRYFVCQTRHDGHNPSLNKSIYLWGKKKGTGKTTVGRAIITILNGDKMGQLRDV